MGAWGHKVLSNDRTLDYLALFRDEDKYDPANIVAFLNDLCNNPDYGEGEADEEGLLLYAAIVDASINGPDTSILGSYAYDTFSKMFWEWLTLNPLTDYVDAAISAVDTLIAYGVDDWVESSQQKRMDLYYKLKDRLSH